MSRTKMVIGDAPQEARQVRAGRRSVRAAAALRLGLWRIRPAWRLLVVVQVGMIAALLVTCAVPLFSRVALYAGLQGALDRDPSSRQLNVGVDTNTPSPQLVQQVEAQVAEYVKTYLAGSDIGVQGRPDISMTTTELQFIHPSGTANDAPVQAPAVGTAKRMGNGGPLSAAIAAQPLSSQSGGPRGGITLFGYSYDQQAQRLRLLDGRLPLPAQDGLEIAITAPTASKLHLHIGSSLTIAVAPRATAHPLVLRVVGIFASTTPASYPNYDPNTAPSSNGSETSYYAVADRDAISQSPYPWSSLELAGQPAGNDGSTVLAHWAMSWIYQLDLSRLKPDRVSALLQTAPAYYANGVTPSGSPTQAIPTNGDNVSISTGLYTALRLFQHRIAGAQIVVGVLLIAIVGLMVLFVAQMSSLLIERQEGLIALLRSRGASRRQMFVTFAMQGIVMALVALLAGPVLAVPLMRQVALVLFSAQKQSVADALAGNPITL
ncbi:MAG: FtsX-like permease family protein, partial [Ktedonobacterales bacterium]